MKTVKGIIICTITTASIVSLLFSGEEVVKMGGRDLQVVYQKIDTPESILGSPFDCESITPVVYRKTPSLRRLPTARQKEAFVRIILPSILIAEHRIRQQRTELLGIVKKINRDITLTGKDITFVSGLFNRYRTSDLKELLTRLNVHPPSIILAQAALESGWGSSRFFSEGNNVFGVWTFRQDAGIKAINSNARLLRYDSTLDSVEDYLFNINVGWAYERFREMRVITPRSLNLISYLDNYSTLRKEYVNRLNTILRSNHLEIYDNCRIDPDYLY